MRAIVLEKFGGLDSLVYKDIPEPEPKAGHVVIEIKAFGINHAEMHMRRGEWAEAAPVSGIECVGIVKSCPGGEFPVGAKVAALDGWPRPHHQRQLRRVHPRAGVECRADRVPICPGPSSRQFPRPTRPPGPACSATWRSRRARLLVIRGATSSFGQAALKMAVNAGVRVIATTRSRDRFAMLEKLGATRCEIERPDLSKQIAEAKQIDAVLDLVGNSSHARFACDASPRRTRPAWPAGSAASLRSPTSTRCCRWRAAFI